MYLLAISIGPVQDFIASARRSRDLWFGSWWLSEISKAAAYAIHSNGGELIFPSPAHPDIDLQADSSFSVSNKILARVRTSDIQNFCREVVYAAMTHRLGIIREQVLSDLKGLKIHWKNAGEQIDDLIEFYWAASPFDENVKHYDSVRRRVEALLAARKTTRNFDRPTWSDNIPKSSLDGLRESVIDESIFNQLEDRNLTEKAKADIQQQLRVRYGLRGKERLCGIGLVKRHGKPKGRGGIDSFLSTSHVAALPLLNRLRDRPSEDCSARGTEALRVYIDSLTSLAVVGSNEEFKKTFGHIHPDATLRPHRCFAREDGSLFYDGHLLFRERLHEFFRDQDTCRLAEAALATVLKAAFGTKEDPNPSPHPYYAILHADGDRMGAVIDQQSEQGHEAHKKLSEALSGFAEDVKQIVEVTHDGSSIYSGGDDVLALLPLHTALDCARHLADRFQAALNSFPDKDGKTPTLSVGLAIGHHLDPLQDTLSLAREAEKLAKKEVPNKQNPQKNALAVTLSKRSGADRTVKGSWDKAQAARALDCRLNRFIFLLLDDELPDGVAYQLQDLALRLTPSKGANEDDRTTLMRVQRAEAKRILRRKQPKRGALQRPADKILDEFCGFKGKQGQTDTPGFIDQTDLDNWTLADLANELIIARELAKAIEQADTKEAFAAAHGFVTEDKELSNDGK